MAAADRGRRGRRGVPVAVRSGPPGAGSRRSTARPSRRGRRGARRVRRPRRVGRARLDAPGPDARWPFSPRPLHVVAAGVWAGGLVVVLRRPATPHPARPGDPSRPGARGLARLQPDGRGGGRASSAATGVYLAGRQVESLSTVSASTYGTAVVAKVLLLATALVIASYTTLVVNPRLADRLLGRPGRAGGRCPDGWPRRDRRGRGAGGRGGGGGPDDDGSHRPGGQPRGRPVRAGPRHGRRASSSPSRPCRPDRANASSCAPSPSCARWSRRSPGWRSGSPRRLADRDHGAHGCADRVARERGRAVRGRPDETPPRATGRRPWCCTEPGAGLRPGGAVVHGARRTGRHATGAHDVRPGGAAPDRHRRRSSRWSPRTAVAPRRTRRRMPVTVPSEGGGPASRSTPEPVAHRSGHRHPTLPRHEGSHP